MGYIGEFMKILTTKILKKLVETIKKNTTSIEILPDSFLEKILILNGNSELSAKNTKTETEADKNYVGIENLTYTYNICKEDKVSNNFSELKVKQINTAAEGERGLIGKGHNSINHQRYSPDNPFGYFIYCKNEFNLEDGVLKLSAVGEQFDTNPNHGVDKNGNVIDDTVRNE